MTTYKNAIGYIRVSTRQQGEDDKYGIESQKQSILLYADKNGYHIVDDDNKVVHYVGDMSYNGYFYKNLKAWEENNGVIYINEYGFEDLKNNDISTEDLWTRKDWVKYVKDYNN